MAAGFVAAPALAPTGAASCCRPVVGQRRLSGRTGRTEDEGPRWPLRAGRARLLVRPITQRDVHSEPPRAPAIREDLALPLAGVAIAALVCLSSLATRRWVPNSFGAAAVLLLGSVALRWWLCCVPLSPGNRVSSVSTASKQLPRETREQVTLPFATSGLWDFMTFPKTRRIFGRQFTSKDLLYVTTIAVMHILALLAPFTATRGAVLSFLVLHVVTGVAVMFSFHRQLSHRSFSTPKFIEYGAACIACLAMQGDAIYWVSTHRHHHGGCESETDPHSPRDGLFWCHMGWMWDQANNSLLEDTSNCPDMWKQPFYRFLRKTYIAYPTILAAIGYALGGLPFLVWGVALRTVTVWHCTWLINSASHIWGVKKYQTTDLSMNNWVIGLLAFGEGWHNNHHAFETSARHGFEWWQIDLTWYVIWALEKLGLASKVIRPSKSRLEALAL